MSEDLNLPWAHALVDELRAAGVVEAVVCPGSRSTPLALACAETPGLRVWSVVDERSAAFFALGMAKASGAPTALVCTSGTAGAHFLPAVMEANLGRVPLVVLTADRPWELHGFGAPQTLNQAGLYGPHVRSEERLPEPAEGVAALTHLRALVARAVAQACQPPRGVVHLNVPFREPLGRMNDSSAAAAQAVRRTLYSWPPARPDPTVLGVLRDRLIRTERGLIVCGPRELKDGLREAVVQLGKVMGCPVIAEAASQVRYPSTDGVCSHADLLLRSERFAEMHRPELILRFGGGLTSKALQQFIDRSGAFTVHFLEDAHLFDPAHSAAQLVIGDPVSACESLTIDVAPRPIGAYGRSFLEGESIARLALAREFAAPNAALSEPRTALEVVAALPAGANLFLSSSMPIRDVDAFASRGRDIRVFANRGANGIDGIVSTALGMSVGAAKGPSVLLTGDLACLHDLGGLLIARRHRLALTLVVVNNDGGGIFSFLPIAGNTEHFENLFGTPHGVDFEAVAALAGAKLWRPRSAAELSSILSTTILGGLHLIEVRTQRPDNFSTHRALNAAVEAALRENQ